VVTKLAVYVMRWSQKQLEPAALTYATETTTPLTKNGCCTMTLAYI